MSVTILSATILSVIITSNNVNWVQFNRGTEICSVRLRPDKAGAVLVHGHNGQPKISPQNLTIKTPILIVAMNKIQIFYGQNGKQLI